jgi:hypothetical protein
MIFFRWAIGCFYWKMPLANTAGLVKAISRRGVPPNLEMQGGWVAQIYQCSLNLFAYLF